MCTKCNETANIHNIRASLISSSLRQWLHAKCRILLHGPDPTRQSPRTLSETRVSDKVCMVWLVIVEFDLTRHDESQDQKRQEGCINVEYIPLAGVTFNSSFDTGCLKFKFLDNVIAICSRFTKLSIFGGESYNFDQVKKLCISQGSAVTFFRCDG